MFVIDGITMYWVRIEEVGSDRREMDITEVVGMDACIAKERGADAEL